jgi:hypothetical protein
MATLSLRRRLEELEVRAGATTSLAIGRQCPSCNAHVALDDAGPCQAHRPLREAPRTIVVIFRSPHAAP